MAANRLVISEPLWVFFDNLVHLNSDAFKDSLVNFYSFEDLNSAKKLLLGEIETLKNDKVKLNPRNNTKIDRILDTIELISYAQNNNLISALPTFVIFNNKKIPTFDNNNLLEINNRLILLENKLNEINDINNNLSALHTIVGKLADCSNKCTHNIPTGCESIKNSAENFLNTNSTQVRSFVGENNIPTGCEPTKNSAENFLNTNSTQVRSFVGENKTNKKALNIQQLKTSNWDSEATSADDLNDQYTLVTRRNKRPRTSPNSSSNIQTTSDNFTNSNHQNKTNKVIVGKKIDINSKLQANKVLNKSFFSISNVMKCHRNMVIDYLKDNEINVISCYPVFKSSVKEGEKITYSNNDEESTMFRVCVEDKDVHKMKNSDLMVNNILVREWRFDKKDKQKKTQQQNV